MYVSSSTFVIKRFKFFRTKQKTEKRRSFDPISQQRSQHAEGIRIKISRTSGPHNIRLLPYKEIKHKTKENPVSKMMNHSNNNNSSSLVLLFLILLFVFCELGSCRNYDFIKMKNTLGGLKGIQNSAEIESIARFAVQEHNKKENSMLEFARVVKANEQVVAGKMYHLTLEAIDAGKKNIYEAKVWVKPWMNFKQLQEFKHANDVPLFTSSDLGVIRGD